MRATSRLIPESDDLTKNNGQRESRYSHEKQTGSSYVVISFLAVLVGFLFVLSKYPFLPGLGFVLVLLGFFAPFYSDSLQRSIRHLRKVSRRSKNLPVEKEPESSDEKYPIAIVEDKGVHDLDRKPVSLIDLHQAVLKKADLHKLNFRGADLCGANLVGADLSRMNLQNVNLSRADLREANLSGTDLTGANLSSANLSGANLSLAYCGWVNFSMTDLRRSNLNRAVLINTNLRKADLTGCSVYGISVWDVRLEEAAQADLIITPPGEPTIAVDNLKVAQFVSLLLNNRDLCDVVNTVTAKVVLILGHFNYNHKQVLDALRTELRKRNYLPVVFDFDAPSSRNITDEIFALAHMSRFVIVDMGSSENVFIELQHIVPNLRSIPVQPLLQASIEDYDALDQLAKYPWFLNVYRYKDVTDLLGSLEEYVIEPPEKYYEHEHSQDGDNLATTNG